MSEIPNLRNIKLVLGSSSPRRKKMLKNIGLKYACMPPNIDERQKKLETPLKYVKRLSLAKAQAVWININKDTNKENRRTLVLTADTIVLLNLKGKKIILGKPKDAISAKKTLKKLSGRKHTVITAFTFKSSKKEVTRTVKTEVFFRKLSEFEIWNYSKTKEPLDKAGAYAVQGEGAFFIEKIRGSLNNVIGLPITEVLQELKAMMRNE